MALFECNASVGGGSGGGEVVTKNSNMPATYTEWAEVTFDKPIAALKLDSAAGQSNIAKGRYIVGDSPTITYNGTAQNPSGIEITNDNKTVRFQLYRAAQGFWTGIPVVITAFCFDTLPD